MLNKFKKLYKSKSFISTVLIIAIALAVLLSLEVKPPLTLLQELPQLSQLVAQSRAPMQTNLLVMPMMDLQL